MLYFPRRQFLKITGGFVVGTATVGSISLINNLKAYADAIVTLKCLGVQDGPKFLDGRTYNGTVGLAPSTGGGFSGTIWDLSDEGVNSGIIRLKSRGDQDGPRYLDGRTFNGTVGLAPSTGGGNTGTRWELGVVGRI